MIGRARSSSVNPMALRMPRAGARSGPSVRAAESRLRPRASADRVGGKIPFEALASRPIFEAGSQLS